MLQIRSGVDGEAKHQAALRTLGLKGPGSASLRMSTDPAVWGNVAAVRHLVSVVELARVEHKSSHHNFADDASCARAQVTKSEYGTGTQPGAIWRDSNDGYFGYESERGFLRTYWSTSITFDEFLTALPTVGLQPDVDDPGSYLSMNLGTDLEQLDGPLEELLEEAHGGTVMGAVIVIEEGLEVFWRSPYKRFYRCDSVSAEIGVLSTPPDPSATRRLLTIGAELDRVQNYKAHYSFRTAGKLRRVEV